MVSALRPREPTGQGRVVEVAMLVAAVMALTRLMLARQSLFRCGIPPDRFGRPPRGHFH